jgi:O-antigen ligase
LTRQVLHNRIFFILLLLLAVTLPLSVYGTTFIQFMLIFNWLAEGRFRTKLSRLMSDRAFLIYLLLFLLHVIGMIWTSDFQSGLKSLKIKLPLLLIPFLIVTSDQLSIKEIRQLLTGFIVGCLVGSGASVLALLDLIPFELREYRNASLFINHIRFALMVVLAILFSAFLFWRKDKNEPGLFRYIFLLAMLWLPVYLVILRSLTGMIILIIIVFIVAVYLVRLVSDRRIRIFLSLVIIGVPLVTSLYIVYAVNRFYDVQEIDLDNLETQTAEGNPYKHQPKNKEIENGNYVWLYISEKELEREWNKMSDLEYNGKALNGDNLKFTIIRYLTSKGLRKDAGGLKQLSSEDIAAIESGIANHIYLNRFALYPRIYELIWEFDRYRLGYNPNDKSLIQRYHYLKAGISIAGDNLLYGVGTGDVRVAFGQYYEENDSPLRYDRRRLAHNQYLTFAVAFGIPGLLICLISVIFPVFINRRWRSFPAAVFLLTMGLSMLDEDTLETTPGTVMFGLFFALFILGEAWPSRKNTEK